jgi:hypothetical protein
MRGIVIKAAALALLVAVTAAIIPGQVHGKEIAGAVEAIPQQPSWRPTEAEALIILEAVLGAAEETLGWDNVFCWIALDKCLLLLEELQPAYKPGSPERDFINGTVNDLVNVNFAIYESINVAEPLNPASAECKDIKGRLKEIRAEITKMIERAPVTKEPIPEWRGALVEEQRHRRRKEMLRLWFEKGPAEGPTAGENGD